MEICLLKNVATIQITKLFCATVLDTSTEPVFKGSEKCFYDFDTVIACRSTSSNIIQMKDKTITVKWAYVYKKIVLLIFKHLHLQTNGQQMPTHGRLLCKDRFYPSDPTLPKQCPYRAETALLQRTQCWAVWPIESEERPLEPRWLALPHPLFPCQPLIKGPRCSQQITQTGSAINCTAGI